MRNRLLLLVLAFCTQQLMAQTDTPPYKRFPTLPPFTITQVDSTKLTKEDLKHQPTIIMFFSPDCDHCKHQWEDMKKAMDRLKKYQIVMATYQPFEMMAEFYKTQQIARFRNIKMGRDEKFFLPPFYQINSLPYLALYDKQGKLITTFEGNVKIDKLVKAFEK
jgi:thioredoxin-related protein